MFATNADILAAYDFVKECARLTCEDVISDLVTKLLTFRTNNHFVIV